MVRILAASPEEDRIQPALAVLNATPDVVVLGCVTHRAALLRRSAVLRPDVVVASCTRLGGEALGLVRELCADQPQLPVAVIGRRQPPSQFFAAIDAGARGYVEQEQLATQLRAAVRVLAAGGAFLPPQLGTRFLDAFRELGNTAQQEQERIALLSRRQRQILHLVGRGARNSEIAEHLGITVNAVKRHIHLLTIALAVRNRQHVAAFAARYGVGIPPHSRRRHDDRIAALAW